MPFSSGPLTRGLAARTNIEILRSKAAASACPAPEERDPAGVRVAGAGETAPQGGPMRFLQILQYLLSGAQFMVQLRD